MRLIYIVRSVEALASQKNNKLSLVSKQNKNASQPTGIFLVIFIRSHFYLQLF